MNLWQIMSMSLSDRRPHLAGGERTLLKLHFVDGLGIDLVSIPLPYAAGPVSVWVEALGEELLRALRTP